MGFLSGRAWLPDGWMGHPSLGFGQAGVGGTEGREREAPGGDAVRGPQAPGWMRRTGTG